LEIIMPNSAHQNDVQIDRVHSGAVSKEMGERLSAALGSQSVELPPHLLSMMKQLERVEPRDVLKNWNRFERMKDFSNASFPPDLIKVMTLAMKGALSTLPHPVSLGHVQSVAETILRTAKDGERDPAILQRMALLELQITPRD
jgi:hypothetical protein